MTFSKNKSIWFFLTAAVFILAICFKLNQIRVKDYLSPDEVLYCSLAVKMATNLFDYSPLFYYKTAKQRNPERKLPAYFNKPLFKHPPMYCLLLVIPQRFGLQGLKNINYFSFFLAVLLPFSVFFLAKKLFGVRTALFSFLFLLLTPVYWLCCSRLWMESLLSLFMCLSLLFFVHGWERSRYYILSGAFLGFAMLTKYPGVLIAPILLIFTALYKPKLFKEKNFYLIFLTAFIIFLPWIIWNIKVYGSFGANLSLYGGWSAVSKPFLNASNVIFLLLSGLLIAVSAFKGYIAKIMQKIEGKKVFNIVAISSFLLFIFSLPNVRQGIAQSLLLNKLPPVSNHFPSIFAKEPWFFYLGQLLKMSPLFIFSYFGLFFFNSKDKGNKLLLLSVLVILAFYIKWGNYQSRYILSALPALAILGARSFFWLWDALPRLKNLFWQKLCRGSLISLLAYFVLKTIIVDIRLSSALLVDGYFTYF